MNYKQEIQYLMKRKDHTFYNELDKLKWQLTQTLYHLKDKCYNKKNPFYKYFGKKEIEVCPEWKNDFNSFFG